MSEPQLIINDDLIILENFSFDMEKTENENLDDFLINEPYDITFNFDYNNNTFISMECQSFNYQPEIKCKIIETMYNIYYFLENNSK
jgi:hypothetical protein